MARGSRAGLEGRVLLSSEPISLTWLIRLLRLSSSVTWRNIALKNVVFPVSLNYPCHIIPNAPTDIDLHHSKVSLLPAFGTKNLHTAVYYSYVDQEVRSLTWSCHNIPLTSFRLRHQPRLPPIRQALKSRTSYLKTSQEP